MPASGPASRRRQQSPQRSPQIPDSRDPRANQEETPRPPPCRIVPVDLWFSDVPAELERAKVLCTPCALRRTCLHDALTRRETWGVWGGEIVDHGTVIARKRPRGRPPRADRTRPAAGGDA